MTNRTRHKTRYAGVYYRDKTDGGRQYMYWYTDTDGKDRFVNHPGGERDTYLARCKVVDRIAHGHHVAPTKLRLAEWAETWLEEKDNIKPKTLLTYQTNSRLYVVPHLGRVRVCDLSVNHVARMISTLRKDYKPSTINGALAVLSGMMRTAVRRGYAAANPVTQLDRHERPQGQPERMNILDTDEIRLVLAGCSQTYYALLATAVFTGLRMGELRNLKWEDVDWDAGVLGVRDSKTKAGVREVVLMPALQQILATHSLDHSGELVFATKTGKTIHPSSLRRDALTPALEKAGVTKRIRFHDLRHTYASILISQGHDEAFHL